MAKKEEVVVYRLHKDMESQSGTYIPGTNAEFNLPREFPIPNISTIYVNGMPQDIRFLINCPFLDLKKQEKEGFGIGFKTSPEVKKLLTFIYGELVINPEVRGAKLAIEYLDSLEGNVSNSNRSPYAKKIFFKYDAKAEVRKSIANEDRVLEAKAKLFSMSLEEKTDLYVLLKAGGVKQEVPDDEVILRYELSKIADSRPDAIINGTSNEVQETELILQRAINDGVVRMDTLNLVTIKSADGQYGNPFAILEGMGKADKFKRAVEFLLTDAGQAHLALIRQQQKSVKAEDLIPISQKTRTTLKVKEKEPIEEKEETMPSENFDDVFNDAPAEEGIEPNLEEVNSRKQISKKPKK